MNCTDKRLRIHVPSLNVSVDSAKKQCHLEQTFECYFSSFRLTIRDISMKTLVWFSSF